MSLIKCRCGKSEMEFKFLKAEDCDGGYEGDCCSKAEPVEAAPEAEPNPPEVDKEPAEEAPEEPKVEASEEPAEAPAEEAKGEPAKKRGRPKAEKADKAAKA